jgi:hypothetical protein
MNGTPARRQARCRRAAPREQRAPPLPASRRRCHASAAPLPFIDAAAVVVAELHDVADMPPDAAMPRFCRQPRR